uniref:Uncharacterized protein n=1 Tax=Opuntia streptacantha TaxID=393608 RepID=A0A7C9EUW7_OPUST
MWKQQNVHFVIAWKPESMKLPYSHITSTVLCIIQQMTKKWAQDLFFSLIKFFTPFHFFPHSIPPPQRLISFIPILSRSLKKNHSILPNHFNFKKNLILRRPSFPLFSLSQSLTLPFFRTPSKKLPFIPSLLTRSITLLPTKSTSP